MISKQFCPASSLYIFVYAAMACQTQLAPPGLTEEITDSVAVAKVACCLYGEFHKLVGL